MQFLDTRSLLFGDLLTSILTMKVPDLFFGMAAMFIYSGRYGRGSGPSKNSAKWQFWGHERTGKTRHLAPQKLMRSRSCCKLLVYVYPLGFTFNIG